MQRGQMLLFIQVIAALKMNIRFSNVQVFGDLEQTYFTVMLGMKA